MNVNQAIRVAKSLAKKLPEESDKEALAILIKMAQQHQRQEKARLSVSWKSRHATRQ